MAAKKEDYNVAKVVRIPDEKHQKITKNDTFNDSFHSVLVLEGVESKMTLELGSIYKLCKCC